MKSKVRVIDGNSYPVNNNQLQSCDGPFVTRLVARERREWLKGLNATECQQN
jgi:hypothetical protein